MADEKIEAMSGVNLTPEAPVEPEPKKEKKAKKLKSDAKAKKPTQPELFDTPRPIKEVTAENKKVAEKEVKKALRAGEKGRAGKIKTAKERKAERDAAKAKKAPLKVRPKEDVSEGERRRPGEVPEEERQGQNGVALDFDSLDQLNEDERAILLYARKKESVTIDECAEKVFNKKPTIEKAKSHTRNALRRPVRGRLLNKIGRGTYKVTAKGMKLDKAKK